MIILDHIPEWAYGIGFIIIVILIVITVISLLVLFLTRNIKSKWFSISNQKINPEFFSLIMIESLSVKRKIDRIEDKLRMEEQMSFVDDEIKDILEITTKIHRHILQSKGVSKSESENHSQVKMLSQNMECMLYKMKGDIRERFREIMQLFCIDENINNDFNFIKGDFESYYIRVSESMIQDARSKIRDGWIDHESNIIERRESWDKISEALHINGDIGKIIKNMFTNAVKVQLKYSKEIKKLENQMKDSARNYIDETK